MAFAQFTGTKSDEQGVRYTSNEDGTTCYVSGHEENYNAVIVIPESFEGLNVTSIGHYAFSGCSGLTSVTIPNSVTSIGHGAFFGCTGLTSVTIPNSVTSFGYNPSPFKGCSGLTSVTFHCKDVGSWFSNNTSIKEIVLGDEVTTIGNHAFYGCTGLTSVTIPNSVTSIGDGAFWGLYKLTSITFPNSVTSIGRYAFNGCGIVSITIPNSLTSIDYDAFRGLNNLEKVEFHCSKIDGWFSGITSLKEVILGDEVEELSDHGIIEYSPSGLQRGGAFFGCSELSSISLPNSLVKIGRNTFSNCTKLTSITIPNSVTTIGDNAFQNCTKLTSVTIPSSLTSIGFGAFADCSSLASFTIPKSIITIGNSAFAGCSTLSSVTFHCKDVGNWFSNNTAIKEIVLGDEVTTVNYGAFSGCTGITAVTIPNAVTSIGQSAFADCSKLGTLVIGNAVNSIGANAFENCSSLTSIKVREGNAIYDSRNNSNAIIVTASNQLILGCKNTVIPNSVKSIGRYAFSGCSGLTTISIPSSVTQINNGAFRNCTSLSSVNIPSSVTNVASDAYSGCDNIKSVELHCKSVGNAFKEKPSITSLVLGGEVTSIGNNAFQDCTGLTSVTIPNAVKTIGDYAFWNCSNITTLIIGNSVTSIGTHAFNSCSGITTVTIPKTVTSIGRNAFFNCTGLEEVNSLIEKPFNIDRSVFATYDDEGDVSIFTHSILNVPAGTGNLYSAAEGWKEFKYIVDKSLSPVDNDDKPDYGNNSDIDEGTPLNGNVIGNIYYNIGSDDGGYNSAEGCIVVNTSTPDNNVSGKDIFGEDFKNHFTGIVFKIPSGSGTITVNAKTTGGMTLKVKVGNNAPNEFTLNGTLEAKLPYTVSEPTYVYIYGGSSSTAGAKGVRKAAGDGEVKIYGISWTSGTDGIKEMKDERLKMNDSDVYNLNGQKVDGMPTKKGVYIKDGKKVLVK